MENKLDSLEWKKVFQRGIIHEGNLALMEKAMKKAASGEKILIGFIGGSITAGSIASSPRTCYAYLVYSWWKDKFPQSQVGYLNAGIGATTSQFAVARVEEDLLNHDPDVIYAEFSVNDADNEFFQESFEGLIRRILSHVGQPALFIFNNVFYNNGINAQRVHNEVGIHYDLPIVSMKESLYQEILLGNLKEEEITPDHLHPNDLGHSLVAQVIIHRLEQIYHRVFHHNIHSSPYCFPKLTVTKNRLEGSFRYHNRNSNPILNGFEPDLDRNKESYDVFRNGWRARKAGSSIQFLVEGSWISIQYRKYVDHPAPLAKVVIDNQENRSVILDANFEETWGDCLYLQDITRDEEPGKHTVTITILEEGKDKDFYLASIITA